jgi:hypothetical protein
MDMDFAFAQHFNDARISIHAEDFDTVHGEGGGGRQANVTEAKDTDFFEIHASSLLEGVSVAGLLYNSHQVSFTQL